MKSRSPTFKNLPLKIAGSTVFGRYPKISVEQSFNMIVSDGWLVPYAGFTLAAMFNVSGKGRGIFHSTILNKLVVVIGSTAFTVNPNLSFTQVGSLVTSVGDVFIDENNAGQIALCDKLNIYIYDTTTFAFDTFTPAMLGFTPGYIAFQDTYFIAPDLTKAQWRLSAQNDGTSWPFDSQHVAQFQTKPDIPVAAFRFPGKGNLLFVIGSTVTELWTDVGAALFPYQRNTGVNIDYGCLNPDTVANLDEIVCWLGANDRTGPVILVSTGSTPERISNDGIDFKLNSLTNPQDSHGFMFRQDGHLFYQLTFPTDNFSITFDFTTKQFFTVSDTLLNYHPAKRVAYFNNTYYFVSLNDGNLYEMSTSDTTYNGAEIPRIRICPTIRMPDTAPFVTNNLSFPIEQGVDGSAFNPSYYTPEGITTEDNIPITTENGLIITTESGLNGNANNPLSVSYQNSNPPLPVVDLSVSYDGGYTFGNNDRMTLNSIGNRRNRFIYYSLGWSNEFTPLFRMSSMGRWVAGDGTVSIYQ